MRSFGYTDKPRLSVVMPVYNAERYVQEALDSLLSQSVSNIDLLVVNDGSKDGSGRILNDIAKSDPRVRVFERENRGIPASVNELFGMVETEYVTRMDADDVCLPDRFAHQIAHLDAHPEIVALGTQALNVDSEGRPMFTTDFPLDHETIDASNLRGGTSFTQSSVMMRMDAIQEVGGYDEHYPASQDLDLWLRIAEIGSLANLPDVLLKYRFTESGISGADINRQAQLAERACRAAWTRRGLPDQSMPKGHWRPDTTNVSRHDFALEWGWRSWKAGYPNTAWHYFLRAIQASPFSRKAWKALVLCKIRKPPALRSPANTKEPSKGSTRH